jgi:hypothetical protein
MDSSVAAWQEDARRAFQFIATLYEQAQTAWEDAQGFFEESNWTTTCGSGGGGLAMSMSDLREWPFAYLKAMGAFRPNEPDEASEGTGALFGMIFHDTKRGGPQCVAGTFAWSDAKANCDHWIMLAAFGGDVPPGYVGAFEVGPGPIHRAAPTAKARKLRPGVEEIRWFEIPLGSLNSAERLREVVSAAQAMVDGDDARALTLLGEVGADTPKS